MKTTAVRLYGKKDLRLETFDLPEIKDDEILVEVISDSICMSTYKTATLGEEHKRVPKNVKTNPVILGHETAGNIIKVGKKWQNNFKVGEKFCLQPALNYKGSMDSPGYSYQYCGGNATYMIMPQEVMELNCLLPYKGKSYYEASLAEPMSCVIGAFHASFHTKMGSYVHEMGIKEGGKLAILAGCGPMGLGAINYILNCDRRPSLLVITDLDDIKLTRASKLFNKEYAKKRGVDIHFVNPTKSPSIIELTDGKGYDDVFVYAPSDKLLEEADNLLGKDGCLNFFAGPTDTKFTAKLNYYNIHYGSTHVIGTTGGNTDDMRESLEMCEKGLIDVAVMITHIGGIDSAAQAILDLPNIAGGKKMIYNFLKMPLTALDEFEEKGKGDPMFKELAKIVKENNGLWCLKAEEYLLANCARI